MSRPKDIFCPRSEPALTLYNAFQDEAQKRNGRSFEDWNNAEIDAVFQAAQTAFPGHGLRVPTRQDVAAAQSYATGSFDYGATWVYTLINRIRRG